MATLNEEIGRRIKLLRVGKNMSQDDFAKSIGIKQAYVGKLERGKFSAISPDKILKIIETLETTADVLLGKSDLVL